MERLGRDPAHGGAAEVKPADTVQLSSDARRRIDEMLKAETIAEAYVKHIVDTMREAQPSDTEQQFGEEDAERRYNRSLESFAVDLKWLVEALGAPPDDAAKLQAALQSRSLVDYHQSRPPVPEIILRAEMDRGNAAVFVHGLSFDLGHQGIERVAVEKVAVIKLDNTLAGQLDDPNFPRVVVVGENDAKTPGVDGSVATFKDNLTARLAAAPPDQLQGMLIVREVAATAEARRLRVDALSRI